MKYLILLMLCSPAMACDEVYLKVGAGYKFSQTDYFVDDKTGERSYIAFNDPLSARIEVGVQKGAISYGVSHHSNWLTGSSFNDEGEVQKTEVFIDFKFSL